jgi:hypothetical protein
LRGREGLGSVGFDAFVKVKCLFSTAPEAKGSHWGDRALDRRSDRTRLARPVNSTGRRAGRSARVCDRTVRGSKGLAHLVTHLGE